MNLTTKQSLVYVIQAQGTSLCKLGVTTDLALRLRSIQTGCPHKCVVLATWPGSKRLEDKLHKHFAEYRRAGEWFELPAFCGKQMWDIVQSHDTAGLVQARRGSALPQRRGLLLEPMIKRGHFVVQGKKEDCYSQGIAVIPGCELRPSAAGAYEAYIRLAGRNGRRHRKYIGRLPYSIKGLAPDAQRAAIRSLPLYVRIFGDEQSAPAA